MKSNGPLRIRGATMQDAPALAELAGELGYPSSTAEMQSRLKVLLSSAHHNVTVAEQNKVVGWAHTALIQSLESDLYAEMKGLVVTASLRGSGVGSRLVENAERWARNQGCRKMRVRTNVVRRVAVDFYSGRGYALNKRQEILDKTL